MRGQRRDQQESTHAQAVTPERRAHYAAAYAEDESLRAGFALYRAMAEDAKDNASQTSACDTPLLFIRGACGPAGAQIETYAEGFRKAGVRNLETAVIANSGHFIADEQPAALWHAIARAGLQHGGGGIG